MHFLWGGGGRGEKEKKNESIQTKRMEMTWILKSSPNEREHELHKSLNLTKT